MKSKSIVGIVIILVAVGILVYLGGLTYLEYEEYGILDIPQVLLGDKFSGNVVTVDDKVIEVQGSEGKTMKFDITEGTKKMLGDKKLEPTLYVTVIYKATKEKNIAKAIRRPKKVPADLEKKPVATPASPTEGTMAPPEGTPAEPGKPGEPGMEGKPEEKPAEPGMESKPGEEKPAEPGMESKPGEEKPAEPANEVKTDEKPAEGGDKKTE
jgi:hypothetical protein